MFKATIEQTKLVKVLKDIAGSVGKGKQDNPTDASVYMRAYNDNGVGKVKFLSTNFNEWTSAAIDAVGPVVEGIAPLVPHATLLAMANTINPTFEVTLEEVSSQMLSINYVGRKSAIEIPALLPGSFIVEPETVADATYQLPCAVLKEGLDKASKVITDDSQNLMYNCVNITMNANNVLFECIDSVTRRVMAYVVNHVNPVEGAFFVECGKLKSMISGFDDSAPLTVEVSHSNVKVSQGDLVAILRLTFGSFPNVVKFFQAPAVSSLLFSKEEMINSLKRIQAMYDNKSVMKICFGSFDNLFSTLTMNSTKGKISETVTGTLTGDPFNATFSVDTLLRTLFTIDTPMVNMHYYGKTHVCLAPDSPSGYDHKTIVLQIAVKDPSQAA